MVMKTIINFLSNKFNLTVLQCVLYFVLGYMLKDNYSWSQIAIMFIIITLINIIVHVKGVSQGMVMFKLMEEDRHEIIKFISNMEKDKSDKDLN